MPSYEALPNMFQWNGLVNDITDELNKWLGSWGLSGEVVICGEKSATFKHQTEVTTNQYATVVVRGNQAVFLEPWDVLVLSVDGVVTKSDPIHVNLGRHSVRDSLLDPVAFRQEYDALRRGQHAV